MEKAKKFLKAKGLKDTLYNVNYNPNQNRGLPQKEWIKGGLSALLDEYADGKVKNFSSNPFVIKSFFAVAHKKEYPNHRRLILRDTKQNAIKSWERSSRIKFTGEWMVMQVDIRIQAKNV